MKVGFERCILPGIGLILGGNNVGLEGLLADGLDDRESKLSGFESGSPGHADVDIR